MTASLDKFFFTYVEIKYFLNSFRALSDAKLGVWHLQDSLKTNSYLWNWKTNWIGTCAIIRTSISLIQNDVKSCINSQIRSALADEWNFISSKKNIEKNEIYWNFILKERDNIMHHYKWNAYEAWIDDDGNIEQSQNGLLHIKPKEKSSILVMRNGHYAGRNSIELLSESMHWVEDRLLGAIRRAGFDPDEKRNVRTFEKMPKVETRGLLSFDSKRDSPTD
ncbi:MAG: hypothetical protein IOB85_02075 [Methylobacterium sp.]|nr:hypothetical protein [Rhodobacter sp.]MCA3656694.1 hypothetical protein [Methylobacterium sp.]MCA3659498.1 hypothetical protein [Methylobacterium sp.]MCA3660014.1 hypothetical protein [Methylobacterium sp.]MCA3664260.1 hypothetical protein [Methylobacterium sp.]